MSKPALLENLRRIESLVRKCIDELADQPHRSTRPQARKGAERSAAIAKLDFDSNERHFVRTHGVELSGRKKFVLLTAFLAKGEVGREVPLSEIEAMWSRMTGLLKGPFNRNYCNGAKESGWVNTKKKGFYSLRAAWQEALR